MIKSQLDLKIIILFKNSLIPLAVAFTALISPAQELNTVVEMIDRLDARVNQLASKQSRDMQGLEQKIGQMQQVTGTEQEDPRVQGLEKRLDTLSQVVSEASEYTQKREENIGLLAQDLKSVTGELRKIVQNPEAQGQENVPAAPPPAPAGPLDGLTPEAKGFLFYQMDASQASEYSNQFDISRLYVGGKYQINEHFKAAYLTDMGHESKTGKFEVFSKYAYLDWKTPVSGLNLIMGLQGTYNWKQPEKAWGYRGVSKAPLEAFGDYFKSAQKDYISALETEAEGLADTSGGANPTASDLANATDIQNHLALFESATRNGMGSSADLGIGANFKKGDAYGNLLVRNGTGYKAVEEDRYKNLQLRLGHHFLDKNLHVSGYTELEPWEDSDKKSHLNVAWDLLVEYQMTSSIKAGVNYAQKSFSLREGSLFAKVYSGFAKWKLTSSNFHLIGRYDYYDTGLKSSAQDFGVNNLIPNAGLAIVGVDWNPAKNVHVVPNMQFTLYDDDSQSTERDFYLHLIIKL